MSGYALDANIVIDAVLGSSNAAAELKRIAATEERMFISRMVWIEVMSKGSAKVVEQAEIFMSGFGLDEIDEATARRAASLRRERTRLKSPDAIIYASALIHGRTLVTRNTKDFPASMPGIHVPYTMPED